MYHFIDNPSPDKLPGVTKKSFAMSYGGGEIWFEHLDGMYDYKELVLNKLERDSKSFLRPSYPSLTAIILDETVIDKDIIHALAKQLTLKNNKFTRVVIVGMEKRRQKELKKILCSYKPGFALNFDNDLEQAKIWLISENMI